MINVKGTEGIKQLWNLKKTPYPDLKPTENLWCSDVLEKMKWHQYKIHATQDKNKCCDIVEAMEL